MNPKIWGRSFWALLVYLGRVVYTPSQSYMILTQTERLQALLRTIEYVLPCEKCRVSYRRNLKVYPINDWVRSDNIYSYYNWLHRINQTHGDRLSLPQFLRKYGDFTDRDLWIVLFHVAYEYPEQADYQVSQRYREFYHILGRLLNFNREFLENLQPYLGGRDRLLEWTINFHDRVHDSPWSPDAYLTYFKPYQNYIEGFTSNGPYTGLIMLGLALSFGIGLAVTRGRGL